MTDRSSPGEEVRGNALTAFLATAEYVILQAPKGTEGASESLLAAGCWAAPRLLAAVEGVLKLAGEWERLAVGESTLIAAGLRLRAAELRGRVSRTLLGEGETDGH